MDDGRESRGRSAMAGLAAVAFTISFAALISSQLALMSILDSDRAEKAAEQITESRFTADLVDQTVTRAIAPVAGDALAQQAATLVRSDPNVLAVVETSLLNAHGQVVDRDPPVQPANGNDAVRSAIVSSLVDNASANGVDLTELGFDPTAVAGRTDAPEIVPTDLPRLGLRDIADTARNAALLAAAAFAVAAVLIHPRPGRSLRGLGFRAMLVTGTWLVVLLIGGWLIGLSSNTLFGEMIQAVWSDAVTSMLLLLGAGVVIGGGLVMAGIAVDGLSRPPDRTARRYSR